MSGRLECDREHTASVESDLGWALGAVMRGYLRAVDEVVADVPGGPRGYQVLVSPAARARAPSSRWPTNSASTGR